ncbi:MAG: Gfo/Idh/MocA family oxidoreductase [Planctomycetes bacterium]|nr:Gfo/Idh/MocA family oxidoreductase [Planctomycetota bacterium]
MTRGPEPRPTRRSLLAASAALTSGVWIQGAIPGRDPVRRGRLDAVRVAVIGCGGKGHSDGMAMQGEQVVALCDVDERNLAGLAQAFPKARRYADFRELLDTERGLDAVVVSTPDHTHAVAAARAMQRGLHVFCQKPLTHSVEEARVLTMLAARHGVVTQMGNQGTCMDGLRAGIEAVQAGAIGAVREVHVWTNRPVWPQGIAAPTEIQPIPAPLRFDLWLGPRRHRPYHAAYGHFVWRGWWDFGTGALGDMACHIANLPFFALELGAPLRIELEHCEGLTEHSAPTRSRLRFRFPARGAKPPVELIWHDGGLLPAAPWLPAGETLAIGGSAMIGERGVLYSPDDYGAKWRLLPEPEFAGWQAPAPRLARGSDIHREWLEGIKGGPLPMSNFAHAGPFTEAILLGNAALRSGRSLEWEPVGMRIPNAPEAERYLRDEYAWGWELLG